LTQPCIFKKLQILNQNVSQNTANQSVQAISLKEKVKFKISQNIKLFLPFINLLRLRLTILNAFPGIGDVLLLTSLIESIKKKFSKIRLNVITQNEQLLLNNKHIFSINKKPSFFTFRHWYLEIRQSKNPEKHVLTESLEKLGLSLEIQKPKFFVTEKERKNAENLLHEYKTKPLIAINTVSKELTKDWPPSYWHELIDRLNEKYFIIQLGNQNEIQSEKVVRLAGKLDLRESIAVLAKCNLFIGGVSFLMHAASAVGIRSVIIYGGRETPQNSGYDNNINLYQKIDCGPCWIHEEDGEVCENNLECLTRIKVDTVLESINQILK
jgi:ADP-heptose:LPS heptosyltransferase